MDDGSRDSTYPSLTALQHQNPSLVVIHHPDNQGLGAALRTGFNRATGDAVLTLDGDLTFHPRQFPALLKAYEEGADCVLGSPLKGHLENVSLLRSALSHAVNFIYGILLGRPVTSASSIFRLYRATILKALPLESVSFDINAEILFHFIQRGKVVREVPATLTVRTQGVSKINFSREIFNHLKMFARIIGWRMVPKALQRKS